MTGVAWALMLHYAISMSAPMGSAGRGAMDVEMIGAKATLGGLGIFVAIWTVMMGAMMLPSAAPMILTFAAAQARRDRSVAVPTWMFVSQAYPTRPVTIIVPFAPGGATDVGARVVGEHMTRTLGQQFIIENVPGAGGTTGSTRAMRAVADGYTILMGHMGTHAVSVSLYPNLAYKPDTDFEPIGVVVEFPLVLVARKDFPANDLKEFIAYVKANAAKLNMAHGGVGSNVFNFGLLLNSLLHVRPTLVPFSGTGPATNALLSGQVDYMCNGIPEAGPHIQVGTLKAYAVGTAERNPSIPNVPTSKEAGLPEFEASPWFALFAPKGSPQAVRDQLSDAIDQALD